MYREDILFNSFREASNYAKERARITSALASVKRAEDGEGWYVYSDERLFEQIKEDEEEQKWFAKIKKEREEEENWEREEENWKARSEPDPRWSENERIRDEIIYWDESDLD